MAFGITNTINRIAGLIATALLGCALAKQAEALVAGFAVTA